MAPRILVAHQPAYLPWQGYFARLLDVDRLVLLDHVQFAERGRQHRNVIRGPGGGRHLLSVPVHRSGRFGQSIREVEIADPRWAQRHWSTVEQAYCRAPYFDDLRDDLYRVYQHPWTTLHEVNTALIRLMLDVLGLSVRIEHSSTINPAGRRTAMLIDLARRTGSSVLRVGTSAPRYLDAALLAQVGIGVEIISYTHHPYPQGKDPFLPGLAALDLVLHQGPAARNILAAGVARRCWEPVEGGDRP
ncbi:MAG: WbqC family protein [Pseudonocardiaceae bacterium]